MKPPLILTGPLFVGSETEMYAVNMDGHDLGLKIRAWQGLRPEDGSKGVDQPLIVKWGRITVEELTDDKRG